MVAVERLPFLLELVSSHTLLESWALPGDEADVVEGLVPGLNPFG